ncbi:MAG TPA: cupin domain-containing protein [Chloroflexaceae bacterium]|nr:cupin domain-containing protein [Chloroflexaceae bacterium]
MLVALWLPSGLALAQSPVPGPAVLWLFRTPGQAPSGRFHLVHNRTHFTPGAATPFHHHPGQVVVTVLEGENTFTLSGVERVYRAGESFVEQPHEVNQARNAGTVPMTVMATYLLPWDAPLSHPAAGDTTPPPRPTVSYQYKTDVAPMTGPFEVVQQGLEFAPGAATPWHTHPGLVMVTVVAGELTFNINGADTVYREGESFVEPPGELAQARNASGATTRVVATYLLPTGAPLSQPQAAPGAVLQPSAPMPAALPNTGETQGVAVSPALIALIGVGLLLGGAWLRRRLTQR